MPAKGTQEFHLCDLVCQQDIGFFFMFGLEVCIHTCCHFSCVQLLATLWTVALQVPLSIRFSRQEYWSRLPFPSPGDLPDPGIKPMSPVFPALAGWFLTAVPPGKPG